MSRVLIGNLPPGTTIRNIDDFCSPYGRLLYVDVKNQGSATMACVEYENIRNALNLVRSRNGYNFNGYCVQLKLLNNPSPFEVSSMSSWSNNCSSQMFNNGMHEESSFNYDGYNRGNNSYNSNDYGSNSNHNGLDFNETCRLVYDRFLQEGYNRQVAKEKTLDFVSNIQRGTGQGFNNSNIFGQDVMNSSNDFGNCGKQSWATGNNYDNGAYSQIFSNWGGNFNGLNDLMTPQSWRQLNNSTAVGGGGLSFLRVADNFSSRPGRGRNRGDMPKTSGSINNNSYSGGIRQNTAMQANPKMASVTNSVLGSGFEYERYAKSLDIRKKIEARIKSGNKTVRDLRNLQFHNQIISDYEYSVRQQKQKDKTLNEKNIDEQTKLQRYKSALGIVLKYKKVNQSQLKPEERRTLAANKVIVEEYEKSIAIKGNNQNGSNNSYVTFERKKKDLIKQSKLNYPYEFRLSGAAKKKMRMLTMAGIDASEAKHLALHSSVVVNDLIQMKRSIPKIVDKTKQLVPYKATGGAKPSGQQKAAASKKEPVKASTVQSRATADIIAKKLKAGYRSANKVLRKHENSDISKLTDKEKAIIRISLRRLRSYNLTEGKEIPNTKFDFLLNDEQNPKSKVVKENANADESQDVCEENSEALGNESDEKVETEVADGGDNECEEKCDGDKEIGEVYKKDEQMLEEVDL